MNATMPFFLKYFFSAMTNMLFATLLFLRKKIIAALLIVCGKWTYVNHKSFTNTSQIKSFKTHFIRIQSSFINAEAKS